MAVAAIQPLLSAQNRYEATKWFDLQVVQHVGLNKWSDAGYVNNGLRPASITEIRGLANIYLFNYPVFGVFADMGLGIMPAPAMKSFDFEQMPTPNEGTQYYLREMLSESGIQGASAHFKLTAGLFGNIKANSKLSVMPYFGIGGLTMPGRSYEMILKEHGSNMQYKTTYVWGGRGSADDYGSSMLGYMTGRLNLKHKINSTSNLLLGIEYTYFLDNMNFYGRYSNTFNGNIQRDLHIEGNNMSMLGISVGVSF